MKSSDLVRLCADVLKLSEEHDFGHEPGFHLVWPKGSKGRFPIRGHLSCVNPREERVYAVRVADVLAYVARTLKASRRSSQVSENP